MHCAMKGTYMDKKKVAVFATGWSPEILEQYVQGLAQGFENDKIDIYMFLSYAVMHDVKEITAGENNIFELPDLEEFDAAAVFANGMDFEGVFENIIFKCNEANIPVVSSCRQSDSAYFVGSDNTAGAYDLYTHMVEKHNCKKFVFFAGTKDNPDSEARLSVLKRVLEEHDLSIDEKDIIYTDWAPNHITTYFDNKFANNHILPDVYICANDILAVTTCMMLARYDYDVPKDVFVTGYDDEILGELFDPSLATVNQALDMVGVESARLLIDVMNGVKRDKKTMIPSRFVEGCSCGCNNNSIAEDKRSIFCKNQYKESMRNSAYTINLNVLERKVLDGNSYDDLYDNLASYIMEEPMFEGGIWHVILEPSYASSIEKTDTKYKLTGYSKYSDVAISYEHGNVMSDIQFKTKNLLPQVAEYEGKNRFFLFMPLHNLNKNLGYYVLADDIGKVGDFNHLYTYHTRLNTVLEMNRKNLSINSLNSQLIELNAKDALTHVKNRSAYNEAENKLMATLKHKKDYRFGIAMFDINNLKIVNDQFGHEMGDQYIIGACQMICSIFKFSPVFRIGGDEFVVIMTGADYEMRDKLMQDLQDTMQSMANNDEIPLYEKYSVASGLAIYDKEKDNEVADVFNRADEAMYYNKAKMKAKMRMKPR